jgi:steroid delta-isomerase-like uncharacterized protein
MIGLLSQGFVILITYGYCILSLYMFLRRINMNIDNDVIAAWNAHDPDKILSFFSDDVLYEDLAIGKTMHGKQELAEFIKLTLNDIPDFHIEATSLIVSGDWVASEAIMSGTMAHSSIPGIPATGKSFSLRAASIMELSNGKIRRETDYYNAITMMQQIGAIPSQPT